MADEQTILISDPLFSREAVSQYDHKPDKLTSKIGKSIKSYVTETKMALCDKNFPSREKNMT